MFALLAFSLTFLRKKIIKIDSCVRVIARRSSDIFGDMACVGVSEDMPAGQTPHTIIMFAHNDLVDAVQPGDRVTITGIYRAMPLRANPRQRNVLSVYKTHIDIVHYRKMDAKRLHEADSSDGLVINVTLRY